MVFTLNKNVPARVTMQGKQHRGKALKVLV